MGFATAKGIRPAEMNLEKSASSIAWWRDPRRIAHRSFAGKSDGETSSTWRVVSLDSFVEALFEVFDHVAQSIAARRDRFELDARREHLLRSRAGMNGHRSPLITRLVGGGAGFAVVSFGGPGWRSRSKASASWCCSAAFEVLARFSMSFPCAELRRPVSSIPRPGESSEAGRRTECVGLDRDPDAFVNFGQCPGSGRGAASGYCGTPSVISNQGTLDATNW